MNPQPVSLAEGVRKLVEKWCELETGANRIDPYECGRANRLLRCAGELSALLAQHAVAELSKGLLSEPVQAFIRSNKGVSLDLSSYQDGDDELPAPAHAAEQPKLTVAEVRRVYSEQYQTAMADTQGDREASARAALNAICALLTSPVAPTPRWENVTDAETGLSRNVPPVAPGEQPPPSGWLQALQQAELKPSAPPAVPAEALPNLWCAVCGRTTKHVQDTTDLAWWQCDVCSNKQRIGHTEKGYVAAEAQERASAKSTLVDIMVGNTWEQSVAAFERALATAASRARQGARQLGQDDVLAELSEELSNDVKAALVRIGCRLATQPSPQTKKVK